MMINVGVPSQLTGQVVPGHPYQQVPHSVEKWGADLRRRISAIELRWEALPEPRRIQLLAAAIGLAVGEFIQIHPFRDGNGRTSRVCWKALLARFGVEGWFTTLDRPDEPYGVLMAHSMLGEHGYFVAEVAKGLAGRAPSVDAS